MTGRFIENLERHGRLAPSVREALERLLDERTLVRPGEPVVIEGGATSHCHALLDGQAFRHRTLSDGRRQIFCFHVAGDIVDLQGLAQSLDYGVTALTTCRVAAVSRA